MRHTIIAGGALLLGATILTGCAPARIDLDPQVREQLPSATTVHVVVYPAEAPPLMTAKAIGTGSLFGPIGGAVVGARAATIGKELMEQHKVENLALQLANQVSDALKDSLPTLTKAIESPVLDDVAELKKAGLRPFVLDVRSAGSIIYYPSNWARYRLLYTGRVRLVDIEQGRVIWQGVCQLKGPDDPAQSPTLDELEAKDGVAYRRMISEATAACAADMTKQFRGEAAPKS
jgi:hypothetical protein